MIGVSHSQGAGLLFWADADFILVLMPSPALFETGFSRVSDGLLHLFTVVMCHCSHSVCGQVGFAVTSCRSLMDHTIFASWSANDSTSLRT